MCVCSFHGTREQPAASRINLSGLASWLASWTWLFFLRKLAADPNSQPYRWQTPIVIMLCAARSRGWSAVLRHSQRVRQCVCDRFRYNSSTRPPAVDVARPGAVGVASDGGGHTATATATAPAAEALEVSGRVVAVDGRLLMIQPDFLKKSTRTFRPGGVVWLSNGSAACLAFEAAGFSFGVLLPPGAVARPDAVPSGSLTGSEVHISQEGLRVHFTEEVLGGGTVVDAFGTPIGSAVGGSSRSSSGSREDALSLQGGGEGGGVGGDGGGVSQLAFNPAPGQFDRQVIRNNIHTGVTAVDSLTPFGRGQSMLVHGEKGTGKTSMGVDIVRAQHQVGWAANSTATSTTSATSITNTTSTTSTSASGSRSTTTTVTTTITGDDGGSGGGELHCVYAATHLDDARLDYLAREMLQPAGKRATLVAASQEDGDEGVLFAAVTACALGEFHRDNGRHAVVVLDEVGVCVWLCVVVCGCVVVCLWLCVCGCGCMCVVMVVVMVVVVVVWLCCCVVVWSCGCGVVWLWLWLWLWSCGCVVVGLCGCGFVVLWLWFCGFVVLWLWVVVVVVVVVVWLWLCGCGCGCGCVVVWLCGCVVVWLCVCVRVVDWAGGGVRNGGLRFVVVMVLGLLGGVLCQPPIAPFAVAAPTCCPMRRS